MKNKVFVALTLTFLSTLDLQLSTLFAQGTAFTYQGRLSDNGSAYTGNVEIQATLRDAASGGNQIATNSPAQIVVGVTNGLFVLPLDFGANFPGAERWLQLEMRTTIGPFTTLTPRQQLTPAPYAIFAAGASNVLGVVPSGGLSGSYNTAVNFNNAANNFTGNFNGNGAGSSNVNAVALGGLGASNFWQLAGNGVAPGQFLGSVNPQPVEFRVNNQRALRLEPAGTSVNVIGGWSNNAALPGVTQATIGGGGGESVVSPGTFFTNRVLDSYGTIAGGLGNVVGNTNLDFTDARGATVGGGAGNTAASAFSTISGGQNHTATNAYSTVGGGGNNAALALSSVIAGGFQNQALETDAAIVGGYLNTAAGYRSFIGGGTANVISNEYAVIGGGNANVATGGTAVIGGGVVNKASGGLAVIGGGADNTAGGFLSTVGGGQGHRANANNSTIVGGLFNTNNGVLGFIGAGAGNVSGNWYAVIGGGNQNQANGDSSVISGGATNTANGAYATVPGGTANSAAGQYSFAAGRRAKANHTGAFVWGDATDADITSTVTNQFTIRAANGVRLPVNAGAAKPVAVGEHYRDNTLVAWGRCSSAGVMGESFGVTNVTKVGTGRYDIVVTAVATGTAALIPVAIVELDTQPVSAATVRIVSINQTGGSTFSVFINSGTFAAVDNDFVFLVTAR